MGTHNIRFYGEKRKIIPEFLPDTPLLLYIALVKALFSVQKY